MLRTPTIGKRWQSIPVGGIRPTPGQRSRARDNGGMQTRSDLRNVAIIAHADHGKTPLVDAMLRQSGAWHSRGEMAERGMGSVDGEREEGMGIGAKNRAVGDHPADGGDAVTINIIDTPGH